MTLSRLFGPTALAILILVPLGMGSVGDADRVQLLAAKLLCNCGCGEILAECSHTECKTKIALKKEIAAAVQQGNTDEQILDEMGARHGSTILLTPAFRGFNTLLWIVPVAMAVLGLGAVIFRRQRLLSHHTDKP
jgi:cytochrome c-type biogenesis protein CcmH/NrfF